MRAGRWEDGLSQLFESLRKHMSSEEFTKALTAFLPLKGRARRALEEILSLHPEAFVEEEAALPLKALPADLASAVR